MAQTHSSTNGSDWHSKNKELPSPSSRAALRHRGGRKLKEGRVVFNIAGNKYRLVVRINFSFRIVYVRFLGTHAQYDQINAETI